MISISSRSSAVNSSLYPKQSSVSLKSVASKLLDRLLGGETPGRSSLLSLPWCGRRPCNCAVVLFLPPRKRFPVFPAIIVLLGKWLDTPKIPGWEDVGLALSASGDTRPLSDSSRAGHLSSAAAAATIPCQSLRTTGLPTTPTNPAPGSGGEVELPAGPGINRRAPPIDETAAPVAVLSAR